MIKKLLAALAIGLGMTAAAQAQDAINFGIISTKATQNLKGDWQPLIDDMSKQTGLKVTAFFAPDYAGIIEAMRFNKVQLAWYGNKSAMEAVDRASGEIFAQSVSADGNPGYWSVILAPKSSKLTSVDDLLKCDRSLNFGIGDPNSTSGFLVPTTFIFGAHNVDPKTCFKNVTNSNHETNAMAVANGQLDAATNNTENLAIMEKNNPAAFAKVKVIWKSPLIPSDPIVWRKDLPEATKRKMKDFFLTYGTEKSKGNAAKEKQVLAGLAWAPSKPSNNDQLLPIRVMELSKKIAKVKSDHQLADADKKAQLEKLEAEKTVIEKKLKASQG